MMLSHKKQSRNRGGGGGGGSGLLSGGAAVVQAEQDHTQRAPRDSLDRAARAEAAYTREKGKYICASKLILQKVFER